MSSGETAAQTRKWDAPLFGGLSEGGLVTASQLEELQRQAYDEGHAAGYADGLAAGEAEIGRRLERLDQLLGALAQPFESLDDEVEKNIVDLAIVIARQLFRREIKVDPSHIVGVVREALELLPAGRRSVIVHLHPEDAELVGELLAPADGERAWSITEDPLINRGGCKVTSESSQIDAQTEHRFQAVVRAIVGEER
jgi:flagellar assembly protein FliH